MKIRFNLQDSKKDIRPVLRESWIYLPMALFQKHEPQALRNHDQTLKRLNERGGLGPGEALNILLDREFKRTGFDDIDDLKTLLSMFEDWCKA